MSVYVCDQIGDKPLFSEARELAITLNRAQAGLTPSQLPADIRVSLPQEPGRLMH